MRGDKKKPPTSTIEEWAKCHPEIWKGYARTEARKQVADVGSSEKWFYDAILKGLHRRVYAAKKRMANA